MTLAGTLPALSRIRPVPSGRLTASTWSLPALGLVMVGVQALGLLAQVDDALHPNIILMLVQGGVYVAAVLLLCRGAPVGLGWVLGIAVALRLMLLVAPPFHSTDVYRYVWDGRVQGAGINPYVYVPNDPALAPLQDAAVWPRINRADYAPTIYPPAAQALFLLVTRVSDSVAGMKIALVLLEGVTAWVLVRLADRKALPRRMLLVYAWSPLAVWEIAGAGHVDAAMATFVMLAVLAREQGRDGWAGVALGLAVLVKFLPVVILPALWRRGDWRLPACLALVVVAGYLPYLGAGWKVLGFLPSYAGEQGLSDGTGFWLARLAGGLTGMTVSPLAYVAFAGCGLAALALALVAWRPQGRDVTAASLAMVAAGTAALSPVYPWYFLWIAPFLCFVPSLPLLWLTAGGAVLYWDDARVIPWVGDVLYGGALLLFLAAVVLPRVATLRSGQFA